MRNSEKEKFPKIADNCHDPELNSLCNYCKFTYLDNPICEGCEEHNCFETYQNALEETAKNLNKQLKA